MNTEEDEFKRIEMESGWRKRQIEQMDRSELCSNYGGFCKKEWVGLTVDEIAELVCNLEDPENRIELGQKIEAKLKERNI
jgi:hypothetical protein